jgi:copper homeostasis protein
MVHSNSLEILEVIVDSLQDAVEAEAGGADRLEVVRDLDQGGLTPGIELVREIAQKVKIPIRVMLRENGSMALRNELELDVLCCHAAEISRIGVDGIVAGFVTDDKVDVKTLQRITEAAPDLHITFHRAFDDLPDPLEAIRTLKTLPQVVRILTIGGSGTWPERRLRLHQWQQEAAPEIKILAGAGLQERVFQDLRADLYISEVHIGRAARIPQETSGRVSRIQVAQLKGSPA